MTLHTGPCPDRTRAGRAMTGGRVTVARLELPMPLTDVAAVLRGIGAGLEAEGWTDIRTDGQTITATPPTGDDQ